MSTAKKHQITVTLIVTVVVDPTDDELLDVFDRSNGPFSVPEVVRAEIESNLDSVSYVRSASAKPIERR